MYSINIIEEEEEVRGKEHHKEGCPIGEVIPHISLNALKGTVGFHTMKVTGKVGKQILHILVDSRSTHNFLNSYLVCKL